MASIRRAHQGDAGRLAMLAEETFRDTFGAMNTAEDMEIYCRTYYGEDIQTTEISDPNVTVLLCESGEKLIAFAQLRWGVAPACVAGQRPGEIQRLYVGRDWHGQGVAQDLMDACLKAMESHGSDVVWLGVWERNPRAIRFYKKFGFVEVGEHDFPVGNDPQRDIVMVRSVAGSRQEQLETGE